MKNETYIEIIQNLVDTNTKEDLQKKCSEVVSKFDEIDKTFIRNTATPFIMSLVGLQDTNKDFSKDLAFDICERKELKEIFKNKDEQMKNIDEEIINITKITVSKISDLDISNSDINNALKIQKKGIN